MSLTYNQTLSASECYYKEELPSYSNDDSFLKYGLIPQVANVLQQPLVDIKELMSKVTLCIGSFEWWAVSIRSHPFKLSYFSQPY